MHAYVWRLCPSPGHMSMCNGMNVFILCTLCVLYIIFTSETKDNFHAGQDNKVFLFYSILLRRADTCMSLIDVTVIS